MGPTSSSPTTTRASGATSRPGWPTTSSGSTPELKGRGGPGDEDVGFDVRVAWEHELGKAGFIGLGWPVEFGGRGATLDQQVIWAEEYARAQAPARVNHMGENLLAPDADRVRHARPAGAVPPGHPARRRALVPGLQRAERRLRPRQRGDTRAARRRRVGDQRPEGVDVARARVALVLRGRAHRSRRRPRHQGLSFLLVPMDQPGVEVRPIEQITGGGEFNEVFFDGARTEAELDRRRGGRRLAHRDGAARLRARRVDARAAGRVRTRARPRARAGACARLRSDDPVVRQRLVDAWIGLRLMKWNAMRSMAAQGRARTGGVDLEAVLGIVAPRARQPDDRRPRRRRSRSATRCRTSSRSNRSCSCSAAPTRSTADRTRSSATCSVSGCSACPSTVMSECGRAAG